MLWITPIVLLARLLLVLSILRSQRRVRERMAGPAREELKRRAHAQRGGDAGSPAQPTSP